MNFNEIKKIALPVLITLILVAFIGSFIVPAPFIWILTWSIVIFAYATGRITPSERAKILLSDGKAIAIFILQTTLCIVLFFILRAYLTWLVDFTPFQIWTKFNNEGGTDAFLNYPSGKVIYELIFVLAVGYLVTSAVFYKDKKCYGIIAFVLFCGFTAQTIVYSGISKSDTAKAITKPLTDKKIASKISKNGSVGGAVSVAWESAFGKSKDPAPAPTPPPRNVGWTFQGITEQPILVCRVYNNDEFCYRNAQSGFWIKEKYGDEYYHNPTKGDKIRSFHFYNIPKSGVDIYIYSKNENLNIDFRIARGRR